MTLDVRDAALRETCPCVGMPLFSPLDPLPAGQRTVVGRNGVFMQLRNAWLDCTTRVGDLAPGLVLPYGDASESVVFIFGVMPMRLLERFIEQARKALPNEAAGALIYDCDSGALRLSMHEAVEAGPNRIRYRIDDLGVAELLAVDLHTHGRSPAFWSRQDDRDDQGMRVCGVFGNLDRATPSAKFRLAMNGLFVPLPNPWACEAKRG